jgi:hypothetical protein
MKQPKEVLDFKSFMNGETVVKNEKQIKADIRKKEIIKTTIKVGAITAVILSNVHLPMGATYAAAKAVEVGAKVAVSPEDSWENLINKLLDLLDPIAKIFGMIAGVAIMTGNGKIGLERLFWLSVGYITTRKVDDWIKFLNTI